MKSTGKNTRTAGVFPYVEFCLRDAPDDSSSFRRNLSIGEAGLESYGERFGLLFVDYTNQKRIFKDSAHWYSKVAATQGAEL